MSGCPPPQIGYYMPAKCSVFICTGAPTGNFYTTTGWTRDACAYEACEPGPLGYYFIPSFATESGACAMASCPEIPPGYVFTAFGSCAIQQCDNALVGHYFSKGCNQRPCDDPPPGMRFKVGFSSTPDACPTEVCESTKALAAGYYFKNGCTQSRCTNAPAGFFYVRARAGNIFVDECPFRPCSNAESGQYYVPGFATRNDCPVAWCPPAPPGYFYALQQSGCTLANCTNAKLGQYYTGNSTNSTCPVDDCAPPKDNTYYVDGFSSSADACPLVSCGAEPRAGFYFEDRGDCKVVACDSLVGQFYVARGDRTENNCPTKQCTNARTGWYYVQGFTTSTYNANNCPTQPCDPPLAGFYPLASTSTAARDRCAWGRCPFVRGHHYVHYATSKTDCARMLVPCWNAKLGQYYPDDDTSNDPCHPTMTCPDPIAPGFRFVAPGACDTVRCGTPHIGFFYSDGCEQQPCAVALLPGQFHTVAQSPSGRECPVANCTQPPPGFRFEATQSCTYIKCAEPPLGYYFISSVGEQCAIAACATPPVDQCFLTRGSCNTVACGGSCEATCQHDGRFGTCDDLIDAAQSTTCVLLESAGCNCTGCACVQQPSFASDSVPMVAYALGTSVVGVAIIVVMLVLGIVMVKWKSRQDTLELKSSQSKCSVVLPVSTASSSNASSDRRTSSRSSTSSIETLHADIGETSALRWAHSYPYAHAF